MSSFPHQESSQKSRHGGEDPTPSKNFLLQGTLLYSYVVVIKFKSLTTLVSLLQCGKTTHLSQKATSAVCFTYDEGPLDAAVYHSDYTSCGAAHYPSFW